MKRKPIIFISGTALGLAVALTMGASANRLATFNELAREKGQKYNVNPNFIRAIISVESAGNINAVSPVGARGLMQLMPATAERMGVSRHELFSPDRNMEAGVKYISYLSRLFNNDPRLVAAGYNAGEGAVMKYKGIPPYRETQNYAPAVVARFQLLEACGEACYTREHMANPQKYLAMMRNGNYVAPAVTSQLSSMPSASSLNYAMPPMRMPMRSGVSNVQTGMLPSTQASAVVPTQVTLSTVKTTASSDNSFVTSGLAGSPAQNKSVTVEHSSSSPVVYSKSSAKVEVEKPQATADFVQNATQ